jgi:hypothetical protein
MKALWNKTPPLSGNISKRKLFMMLPCRVSLVVPCELPRLLGIAYGAAFLALSGCSTMATPQAAANYIAPSPDTPNHQTIDFGPGYQWFY